MWAIIVDRRLTPSERVTTAVSPAQSALLSPDPTPNRRAISPTIRRRLLPLVAVVIVLVSVIWGWRVQRDPNVKLGAAPLVGRWHVRWGASLLPAAGVAAGVIAWGPRLAARLRFGRLTITSALTGTLFTFLLAASDGLGHVLDPVVHRTEYWANLATLPDASTMLHHYGTQQFLLQYSVHAKGHPPAFFLLLKALASVGLGRPWVTASLSYLGVAIVIVSVLYAVRVVADETIARQLSPFLIVAPYAVWMGTSADAFYTAVGALGVLALVLALGRDERRARAALALAGGLILGSLLFLTYGAVMFGLLALTIVIGARWRDPRRLACVLTVATSGVIAVVVGFGLAGFWWFDGAAVTRSFYWGGTAQFRPAGYFAVGNLGAALIAIGPAAVFGISRFTDRRVCLILAAAALALLAADASQYSKAEVERIWLLFYPWLLTGAAILPHPRRWISAQAVLALGLQLALVSKW